MRINIADLEWNLSLRLPCDFLGFGLSAHKFILFSFYHLLLSLKELVAGFDFLSF
jgi:hypothetical protein